METRGQKANLHSRFQRSRKQLLSLRILITLEFYNRIYNGIGLEKVRQAVVYVYPCNLGEYIYTLVCKFEKRDGLDSPFNGRREREGCLGVWGKAENRDRLFLYKPPRDSGTV